MHSQRKNFLRDPARPTGRHSPITSGKAPCTNTCHDRIFAHSRSANLMRPLLGAFVETLIQRASSAASCFFALRMLHSRSRERASTSNTRVAACSQLRPHHSPDTTPSCRSRSRVPPNAMLYCGAGFGTTAPLFRFHSLSPDADRQLSPSKNSAVCSVVAVNEFHHHMQPSA
jgi:hypothetical protein